jgi:RNA polymerase sigma-70 factor (ECF subfamily)
MAAGDTNALATLYDTYAPLLKSVAMKILRDEAEVEDLLHDVFVEVWQKAGTYDPARGTVRTWLCLRMRSRALDRTRLSRRVKSDVWNDADSAAQVDDTLSLGRGLGVMQRHRLRRALQVLTNTQRDVISLAYLRGRSCSEIATELKLPIGTVKSRLASARKVLARAMTAHCHKPLAAHQ